MPKPSAHPASLIETDTSKYEWMRFHAHHWPELSATERVREHTAGAAADATKLARIPAAREGTPTETAEAVRWPRSPAAAYCIGSVLTLDGVYTLGIPGYG